MSSLGFSIEQNKAITQCRELGPKLVFRGSDPLNLLKVHTLLEDPITHLPRDRFFG